MMRGFRTNRVAKGDQIYLRALKQARSKNTTWNLVKSLLEKSLKMRSPKAYVRNIFLLMAILELSCYNHEKIVFKQIDYLRLNGINPAQNVSLDDYPCFEILDRKNDERDLIIWFSIQKSSKSSFKKINGYWTSIKQDTIDEGWVNRESTILKDSVELKYGCSIDSGVTSLHRLSINKENSSIEYSFETIELRKISKKEYPDVDEILRKAKIRSVQKVVFALQNDVLKMKYRFDNNAEKVNYEKFKCYDLKSKILDSKSWKAFFLVDEIDCALVNVKKPKE